MKMCFYVMFDRQVPQNGPAAESIQLGRNPWPIYHPTAVRTPRVVLLQNRLGRWTATPTCN
jgi:hypothetical protein